MENLKPPVTQAEHEAFNHANSPVMNPPHKFSEGQEFELPDGTSGKIVSVDRLRDNVYEYVLTMQTSIRFSEEEISMFKPKVK